ncbi:MAG TPA: DinB family protein [Stellaceae bacterium]|nr:DinB family protein [Stellaceae bacterium]
MCRTNSIPPAEVDHADAAAFAAKLAALAAMPQQIEALRASIPRALWKRGAGNGKFSIHEHLCHLRDIEIEAYRARIERMLSEETPVLADLDGARLARERNYHRQDMETAGIAWAAIRADLLRRLADLTPAERQRPGVMEGVGPISIDGLVEMMLAHDREHREEIAALRDELTGLSD